MTAAPKRNHNTHGALPGAHPRVSVCALQPQVCHSRVRYTASSVRSIALPPLVTLDRASPGLGLSAVDRARGAFCVSVPRLAGRVRCGDRSDNGMEGVASWRKILREASK
jgi:hypothetical protein